MESLSQIMGRVNQNIHYAANEIANFIEKNTTVKIQHVTTATFLGLLAGTWYYAAAYHTFSLVTNSIMFGCAIGLVFLFLAATVAFFKQIRASS
jgi:hypothetical protein